MSLGEKVQAIPVAPTPCCSGHLSPREDSDSDGDYEQPEGEEEEGHLQKGAHTVSWASPPV